VEFQDCVMEENFVSFKLPRDIAPNNGDWIGLFSNEFSSLDDYYIYEYVNRSESLFYLSLDIFNYFLIILIRMSHNDAPGRSTSVLGESHVSTERIFFNDAALRPSEMYCLVYVAQRGDFTEVLGVSRGFSGPHRSVGQCVSPFT